LTARIFVRLIVAVLCVLVVALAAVDLLVSRGVESSYNETLTRELAGKARMLVVLSGDELARIAPSRFHELARAAGGRLTLVAQDGSVMLDSEARPETMENHRARPEIAAALAGKTGSSIRHSPTIGVDFLYVAVPVQSGALRLAVPLSQVRAQVNAIRRRMLVSTALAFLPAIVLAAFFARRVSSRLAAIIDYAGQLATGNFRARFESKGRDELAVLGAKLKETADKLQGMFEQLESEQAELEKLERIRKDFVINVSHELRTPLASIQGYTETLLDGALEDPAHNVRFLNIIRHNAERLGRLVADLMTLSRVELKTLSFQCGSYFANGLVVESVESLYPMAKKRSIAIATGLAPDNPEVFCDSEAVHQILGNLLDNAIKYTPEGGAITVGVRRLGSEFVEMSVRDTGIGIPKEDLARLFERFYRVDKARSRELGGTGLGLSIVKHLVRSQGGEVRVESEPGSGSTFSFTLPTREPDLAGADSRQPELTVL
jgi:two-component system phosphate regulon sensor histidine kinase PhoR